MTLIICEKNSVAQSFSTALHCIKNNSYYKNENFTIVYGIGHMYSLSKPESYLSTDRIENVSQLPIIPKIYKYIPNPKTLTQLKLEVQFIKQNKNNKIIVATDADREGEVIARELLAMSGITDFSNIWRFWVSEALTENVVLEGLKNIKPLSEYNFLGQKGFSRQHADWLIGMNISTLVNLNNKAIFSVGRIQSALLNIIYKRNLEIKNFISEPYFELKAKISDGNNFIFAYLLNNQKETSFKNKESLIKIQKFLQKGFHFKTQVKKTNRVVRPPKLFSLTDLSKVAAELFDFSPTKTLTICQKLYETYKCLSYPRTPSNVMGDENVELYREIYNKLKNDYKYSNLCKEEKINISNKNIFNSAKLEAHHALIPLAKCPTVASDDEKKIYNLVTKRFFQNLMEDYVYLEKEILFIHENIVFKSLIKTPIQIGWKASINEEQKEENLVKNFNEEKNFLESSEILKKMTQPKKQFTEASLLAFMKNPKAESEENEKLVGLGTEATRAGLIKTLFDREYIIKEKKSLIATNKGIYLLNILNQNQLLKQIIDVAETTKWEEELDKSPIEFEHHIETYLKAIFSSENKIEKYENILISCPICKIGKIIQGKWGYYCSNKEKCRIKIPLKFCNASIFPKDALQILSGKTTATKTFKSKAGKTYKAKLKLNKETGKLELEFVNTARKKSASNGAN